MLQFVVGSISIMLALVLSQLICQHTSGLTVINERPPISFCPELSFHFLVSRYFKIDGIGKECAKICSFQGLLCMALQVLKTMNVYNTTMEINAEGVITLVVNGNLTQKNLPIIGRNLSFDSSLEASRKRSSTRSSVRSSIIAQRHAFLRYMELKAVSLGILSSAMLQVSCTIYCKPF